MAKTGSGFLIGLGSNIEPHSMFPRMFKALLSHFEQIHLSRIVHIPPVGMNSAEFFLNGVAFIETDMAEAELKDICNQIEVSLGRDRTDPDRKHKDRPADLDILAQMQFSDGEQVIASQITDEYFLYPLIDELSAYLTHQPAPSVQEGSEITLGNLSFGQTATTIHR